MPRDFEIVEREDLSNQFFRFERIGVTHERFDGGKTRVLPRERLHIGRAVAILPYDCIRDEVLLIEQFRVGAVELMPSPWVIECVAGLVEPREDTARAARRELREEAGIEADYIERIGTYVPSPGAVTEVVQLFVARANLADAGGTFGVAAEDEDIKVHVIKASTAFEWIADGKIVCANALLPLRWLQLNHDGLRLKWQKAAGPST